MPGDVPVAMWRMWWTKASHSGHMAACCFEFHYEIGMLVGKKWFAYRSPDCRREVVRHAEMTGVSEVCSFVVEYCLPGCFRTVDAGRIIWVAKEPLLEVSGHSVMDKGRMSYKGVVFPDRGEVEGGPV